MQPGRNLADLLARALDGAANAILITEADGRIIWVNKAFCRLSGYRPHEVLGKTPRLLRSGAQGREYYQDMWNTLLRPSPWQGELIERRRDGSTYTVTQVISPLLDAQGAVTHFVAIQQDISEGAEERARMRRLAYHDALTDLPNRTLFLALVGEALAAASAEQGRAAVMFLDLDRFKEVNDSLGHAAGDRLLKAVSGRIRAGVRRSDSVARLGGDEFGILLRNLGGAKVAGALAHKLVQSIAQPFDLDGVRIAVGASIGISLYPGDGTLPEQLLSRADAAMYHAKAAGRGTYRFAASVA